MIPIIYDFGKDTENFFLSNFFPIPLTVTFVTKEGQSFTETYPSSEHAFQAAKTQVLEERQEFQNNDMKAWKAKKLGAVVTLRKDWNSAKVGTMLSLLYIKFQNPELRDKLLGTLPKMLIEGNYWHDNFWGVCFCPDSNKGCNGSSGANTLGRLLMQVRSSLHSGPKENPPVTVVL